MMKTPEDCSYYTKKTCSSCKLLSLGILSAAQTKESEALSVLGEYLGSNVEVRSIETLSKAFNSRAKAKLSVSGTIENPIFGIVDAHLKFTELEECPLHMSSINRLIKTLKILVTQHSIEPYDVMKKTGELKGVIITKSLHFNEGCVKFVLRSKKLLKTIQAIIPAIKKTHPEFTVFAANVQPIHQAILEGESEEILSEESLMWERYGEIDVAFGTKSFIQVTPEIAVKLYQRAAEWVTEISPKTSLELYCGAGAFTLSLAKGVKRAVGFELSHDAVHAAEISATRNGFLHCEFHTADLNERSKILEQCEAEIIIVNPPRRGLSSYIIELFRNKKPETIIYSSCNVQSLKRDVAALSADFALTQVQCFDMFPLTQHVETLVMLKKK